MRTILFLIVMLPIVASSIYAQHPTFSGQQPYNDPAESYFSMPSLQRTAFEQARIQYNNLTDIEPFNLFNHCTGFPCFPPTDLIYTAVDWGDDGYAGKATHNLCRDCGVYNWCQAQINIYYAQNYSADLNLSIAIHEIGHCLGLDHINNNREVMYPSATNACYGFNECGLTPIAIQGINSIY